MALSENLRERAKQKIAATLQRSKIDTIHRDDSIEEILFKVCAVLVVQHNSYLKKTWENYTAQEKTAHLFTCISAIAFLAEESFAVDFDDIIPAYLARLRDMEKVDMRLAEKAVALYRQLLQNDPHPDAATLTLHPILIGKAVSAWLNTGNKQFIDFLPKLIYTQSKDLLN